MGWMNRGHAAKLKCGMAEIASAPPCPATQLPASNSKQGFT